MIKKLVIQALICISVCLPLFGVSAKTADMGGEAKKILSDMTLDEKVGQLLVCGFRGKSLDRNAISHLQGIKPGGVILFSRNIESMAQVGKLTRQLQAQEFGGKGIPLLIGIDQEGGDIVRLPSEATRFPTMMAVGATGQPDLAKAAGAGIGLELSRVGINADFAPVADVNSEPQNPIIGLRSFGDKPRQVGDMAAAFIDGLQSTGVAATAKHFPGHGAAKVDTHSDLAKFNFGMERLDSVDLVPFRAAIARNVDIVMVGHLAFPLITGNNIPATLNPALATDLLRKKLSFKGLAVSDDMEMGAITRNYGFDEAIVKAVGSGIDMVLICQTPERQISAKRALIEAVKAGKLPEGRLDEAVERILTLKLAHRGLPNWGSGSQKPLNPSDLASHARLADDIWAKAVAGGIKKGHTLKANSKAVLIAPSYLPGNNMIRLKDNLLKNGVDLETLYYKQNTEFNLNFLRSINKGIKTAVIVTHHGNRKSGELIKAARQRGLDIIAIAVGLPYDYLAYVKKTSGYLATYGLSQASVDRVAQVLVGKAKATGSLPDAVGKLWNITE